MMDINDIINTCKKAAISAGETILEVYHSDDFSIESKADQSPLTRADKAAHEKIVSVLEKTGIPILSEEGQEIPFEVRQNWPYFWMIDPLDGTKEFIKRNGEFTVNIALIKKDAPVMGVVYIPVTKDLYFAMMGSGAYKNERKINAAELNLKNEGLRVVASRSHMNEETSAFLSSLNHPEVVSKGSSLKLLMVAEGEADLYPRFAPTMEWDTAAAHIIVEEAGGKVLQKGSSEPLKYNKENLLNPNFIVQGVS